MDGRPGPGHAAPAHRGADPRRRGRPRVGRAVAPARLRHHRERGFRSGHRRPLHRVLRGSRPLRALLLAPHLRAHGPRHGDGGARRHPLRRPLHGDPRPRRRLRDAPRAVDRSRQSQRPLLLRPPARPGPALGRAPPALARPRAPRPSRHPRHPDRLVLPVHVAGQDGDRPSGVLRLRPALHARAPALRGPGAAEARGQRRGGRARAVRIRPRPRLRPRLRGTLGAPLRLRRPPRRGARRHRSFSPRARGPARGRKRGDGAPAHDLARLWPGPQRAVGTRARSHRPGRALEPPAAPGPPAGHGWRGGAAAGARRRRAHRCLGPAAVRGRARVPGPGRAALGVPPPAPGPLRRSRRADRRITNAPGPRGGRARSLGPGSVVVLP